MAETKRTAVLIHGCHLAADLKGKHWEDIVWGLDEQGLPTLAGRGTMGIHMALEYGAELIIFSTGASERDGVKEGEYTRNWAHCHQHSLMQVLLPLHAGLGGRKLDLTINANSELDLVSQNTREECAINFRLCVARGIERVILVSSAWHIERCHAEALKVASMMREGGETVPEIVAIASHDSTEGVVIIEPSHRGDQVKNEFSEIMPGIFKVPPDRLDEFQPRLRQLIAEFQA